MPCHPDRVRRNYDWWERLDLARAQTSYTWNKRLRAAADRQVAILLASDKSSSQPDEPTNG